MTPLFHHDPSSKFVHKHNYDRRPSSLLSSSDLVTTHPSSHLTRLVQPSRTSSLATYPSRRAQEVSYYSSSEAHLPLWFSSKSGYETAAQTTHRSMLQDLRTSHNPHIQHYGERYTSLYHPDYSRSYVDSAYAYRSQGFVRKEKEKKIELERRGEELVMVRRRGRVAEGEEWRGVEREVEWVKGQRIY
jgi:hypothetical protein